VKSAHRKRRSILAGHTAAVSFCKAIIGFSALLITFALSGLGNVIAQIPSNRFDDLENHINGTDTMTVAELQSWATTFAGESATLGDRFNDFLAAVEVVDL
jgi:predicted PurR-regulated permease PerM